VAGVLIGYCWWALFQQYLLNGYFANRLSAAFDARYPYLVALMAGAMFAGAHAPNMLLMGVTLVGGTVAAIAYQRHRNLFFLAFAHALIGTMIWFAVPDTVSHHLLCRTGKCGARTRTAMSKPPAADTASTCATRLPDALRRRSARRSDL
jgi:hypothetical protein